MFLQIRDLGKFFRGDSTPFQLLATTILAGIIAFLPGFRQAPGLMIAAVLLFLILNTNFFVGGLTLLAGKLLGLALQPVSFALGRFLIDEAATPLFTQLINGPVTAWFGFESYVASGGLLLGTAFGLILGLILAGILNGFRRKMAQANESDSYQAVAGNPVSRFLAWVFFGKASDQDWDALSKRKIGKPVRILGVVVAALVIGLLVAAPKLLDETWLAKLASSQLAPHNGATVDIDAIALDPAAGKIAVDLLALCNPNNLELNTLQATRLEANASTADLLARKYALDRLEISGAKLGEPRARPGRRVGPAPKSSDEPVTSSGEGDSTFSVDGVMAQAEEWKARLAEVKKWLDKMSGTSEGAADETAGESLEERLRRQAEELGYANVIASHRIADKPRFTIHQLIAEEVTVSHLPGEILDIEGSNLSTQPNLIPGASTLKADSRSGKVGLSLTLDRDTGPLAFHYHELQVDTVRGWLKDTDRFPFSGGHFRLEGNGTLSGGQVHLPIQVTPVGSQLQIGGLQRPAPQVPFTLLLTGDLDNPSIRPQLSGMLDGMKGQLLEEGTDKLKEKLQEKVGGKLKGLFNRE